MANAVMVLTSFNPDEYWQALEVAHRLVFGYGMSHSQRVSHIHNVNHARHIHNVNYMISHGQRRHGPHVLQPG